MKKHIQLILGLFLLAYSFSSCAQNDVYVHKASVGQPFDITLAANVTTGFKWSIVSYDKNLFTFVSNHYEAPHTKLLGAGGKAIFTFRLNKGKTLPGEARMVFKYARSWEPKSAVNKKIIIHFID